LLFFLIKHPNLHAVYSIPAKDFSPIFQNSCFFLSKGLD